MIARVALFFRRLRRALSRSEWAIRLLGLPVSKGTANQAGLVLIQIDGLSRCQFNAALKRGRLPFLSRLLKREHYQQRTFYSGQPATTPAVQGELFYGIRCAVPAFSFCDATSHEPVLMYQADCAKHIEGGLRNRGEGLLRDGSSWSNIYSGGATDEESHFCAATLGARDLLRSRPLLRLLTFPLFHFNSLIKLIGLLGLEFFIAFRDMCQGVSRGERFREEFLLVFKRVFVCIGLRELLSIGVKIDVARGLPIIHANFLGYDEQAHRRGPGSALAHWSLAGIDRAIKNIYRAAHRSARRHYQVWVFSDHGQEATRGFEDFTGQTLEETIRTTLESVLAPEETKTETQAPASSKRARPKSPWFRLEGGVQTEAAPFTLAAVGPVGHLHFKQNFSPKQRLQIAYRLVRDGQVPGVLVHHDSGMVEWVHAKGSTMLPDQIPDFLPHPDSLKIELCRDLVTLAGHELAGDLILLGWRAEKPLLSFAIERGAHAGPGVAETQGFVLTPERTRWADPGAEFIRPLGLRAAALHFLGRESLPARPPRRRPVTQRLRVMTYNVHSCRGLDGRISPARIAQVIERYQPDVVALQELDFGRSRSERLDQPSLIAEALGMNVCFSPTVIHDQEQYGHALLSHLPLELIRTDILSVGPRQRNFEPRGALWVRVLVGDWQVNLLNTHFGLNRLERFAQVTDLLNQNWLGAIGLDEPVILCGDFNMLPHSAPYRQLTRRLRDVQVGVNGSRALNTFASLRPLVRIDHIFVSPHFAPEHFQVPHNHLTSVASDHLPLIVDLLFQNGTPILRPAAEFAVSTAAPHGDSSPPTPPHTRSKK